MIKRTRGSNPNMNQLLNEDSFTNKKGIDVTQAPPMRDFIVDANNLDVNLDGSLSLRKPLLDLGLYNDNYDLVTLTYNTDVYVRFTQNAISLSNSSLVYIKYTYNGTVETNQNYTGLDFSEVHVTNTATSSLVTGVKIDLATFQNGIFNPNNLDNTVVYGDFRLYKENNTWYLEYIPPYIANILRSESTAEFNPNIAGYYTYALRDTYNAFTISVNGILPYSQGNLTYAHKVKDLTETSKYKSFIYNSINTKTLNTPIYLKAFCNFLKSTKVTYYGVWEYTTDGIVYKNVPEFVTQWENDPRAKLLAVVDNTSSAETLDPTDVKYNYILGVNLDAIRSEDDLLSTRPDVLLIENFDKYTQFRFSIYYINNSQNLSYTTRNINKLSGMTTNIEYDSINNYNIVYKDSNNSSLYNTENFELYYEIPYSTEVPTLNNITGALKYLGPTDTASKSAAVTITSTTIDTDTDGIVKLTIQGTASTGISSSLANDDIFNISKFKLFILVDGNIFDGIKYLSVLPNTNLSSPTQTKVGLIVDTYDFFISKNTYNDGIDCEPRLTQESIARITNFDPVKALETTNDSIFQLTDGPQANTYRGAYMHYSSLSVQEVTETCIGFRTDNMYNACSRTGTMYFPNEEDFKSAAMNFYIGNSQVTMYQDSTPNRWYSNAGYVNVLFDWMTGYTYPDFYNVKFDDWFRQYANIFKLDSQDDYGNKFELCFRNANTTYLLTKESNFIWFEQQSGVSLADNVLYYLQNRNSNNLISCHTILDDGVDFEFSYSALDTAYLISMFPFNIPYGDITEMLDTDFISASKGKKLYYKYRLYSYGEKEFKNCIYVSDSNSFISSLLNTIDLPTTQDSEVTALTPWREYLIAANANNMFLITPASNGYTSKVINTFIGIPSKDSETLKSILNGVIFKSGSKIYSLQPSVYSSNDSILNIIDISKPIAPYIVDTEYDNFAFTTEQHYYLCIPSKNTTTVLKYEYATKVWTKHTYPDRFIRTFVNTVDDIRVIGAHATYQFGKSMEELKANADNYDYAVDDSCLVQYGDWILGTDLKYHPAPFNFLVDTGQKSYSMNNIKQFVESKLIFAILDSNDSIPLTVDVYVDNYSQILHVDPATSSSFWRKMESMILGSDIPAGASQYQPCIKQLFLRYSGKGYTIRHRISGLSYSNFKFYVSYYRYKSTINKH